MSDLTFLGCHGVDVHGRPRRNRTSPPIHDLWSSPIQRSISEGPVSSSTARRCRNQVCSMSSFICSPRRSTSFVGSSTWAGAPGSSRMSPPPMPREQVRETTRIRRRPRDFDSNLTAACVSTIGSITPGRPQRRCAECSRHECRVESSASSCPGSVGRSSRAVSGSISAI